MKSSLNSATAVLRGFADWFSGRADDALPEDSGIRLLSADMVLHRKIRSLMMRANWLFRATVGRQGSASTTSHERTT